MAEVEWKKQTDTQKLETLHDLMHQIGLRQNRFEVRLGELAGEVLELKKKAGGA